MDNNFLHIDEVPDAQKDPEFWKVVQDPKLKTCINFLIINEIRKYDPLTLTPDQRLSHLAKIKGFQELLDFPKALLTIGEKDPESRDEIPEE